MASDEALIARWRSGDRTAARQIVADEYPKLFAFFYRLSGRRETAEELTQELFARLTAYVVKGGRVENLNAWLHRTGLNLWRDLARREIAGRDRGLFPARVDEAWTELPAPLEVEGEVFARWLRDAVRLAVLELPPPHREVIVLHHYEGRSYDEIAALVGVPVGTVRSRLHYAVQHLKRRLGPVAERGVDPWTRKTTAP